MTMYKTVKSVESDRAMCGKGHIINIKRSEMSTLKYTRGPWHQGTDIRQIQSEDGTIICNVSGSVTNSSVSADSKLIAAAPELLEALEMVMRRGRIDDSEEAMNQVAAAIAKVKESQSHE